MTAQPTPAPELPTPLPATPAASRPRGARGRTTAAVRATLAICCGLFFAAHVWAVFRLPNRDPRALDFSWYWHAARAVLHGVDPYAALSEPVVHPDASHPNPGTSFVYPLPAVVALLPFGFLPQQAAHVLFVGIAVAVLVFGVTAGGRWGRLWVLGSVPLLWATGSGQITTLLVGAAALPALGGLLVCKPTVGAALACYRPTRRAVAGAAVLLALSLALQPAWPAAWLASVARNADGGQYVPPLAVWAGPLPIGALLALALLRWRRPEGRLLAALACVPQSFFLYEQLALWLVAETGLEAFLLTALSNVTIALLGAYAFGVHDPRVAVRSAAAAPYVVGCLYLPALLMVLRRPNEGTAGEFPDVRAALVRLRVGLRLGLRRRARSRQARRAHGSGPATTVSPGARVVGPPGDRRRVRELPVAGGGSLDGAVVEVAVDAYRYRVRRPDGREEVYAIRRLADGREALVLDRLVEPDRLDAAGGLSSS